MRSTSAGDRLAPGKRPRLLAFELPDPWRHLHRRHDPRLLQLAATLRRAEALPRVREGVLDAAGCDPAHLDRELRRLGPGLAEAYGGFALPSIPARDPDDAVHALLLDYGAAAPLVQSMFAFVGEIDAGMVASRCVDFTTWDQALAAPLARWSCQRTSVETDEPPIRTLVQRALAANRTALLSLASRPTGADDVAWHALGAVWGPPLSVADHDGPAIALGAALANLGRESATAALALRHAGEAFQVLREAIHDRRHALIAIAAEIDRIAGAQAPDHQTAMILAVRARELVAVGRAVIAWLGDAIGFRDEHPVVREIERERDRLGKFLDAIAVSMSRTLHAIDRLVALEH